MPDLAMISTESLAAEMRLALRLATASTQYGAFAVPSVGHRRGLPFPDGPGTHHRFSFRGGVPQQLALTVLDDGTAAGRFHGGAGFMMLRSQRRAEHAEAEEAGRPLVTRFDPRTLKDLTGRRDGAMLMLAALCPGILTDAGREQHGSQWRHTVRLRDLASTASAVCAVTPGAAELEVTQYGDRDLWDELQAAYMAWGRAGQPGRDRFGMTVSLDGQRIWLDHPMKVLTP
ncbi:hypothetical protein OG339_05925 [Streptosporangium sp. NBC_01495]|nr:hypothetical protein [Streptosporangium sp. NBC_01495]